MTAEFKRTDNSQCFTDLLAISHQIDKLGESFEAVGNSDMANRLYEYADDIGDAISTITKNLLDAATEQYDQTNANVATILEALTKIEDKLPPSEKSC